jgi:hypothetical protein
MRSGRTQGFVAKDRDGAGRVEPGKPAGIPRRELEEVREVIPVAGS